MKSESELTFSDLRQLSTVRSQCQKIYKLGLENKLNFFELHEERVAQVADFILQLIKEDYATQPIPFHSRWRHFEAGGIFRQRELEAQWPDADRIEVMRRHIDLVVVSVLLDAGAGAQWTYVESQKEGRAYGRSEGLGIASLHMFAQGVFSSNGQNPFQVDAEALVGLSLETLQRGFQVSETNPLLGLEQRVLLLRSLGQALINKSHYFSTKDVQRPGFLVDWLLPRALQNGIALADLWTLVIDGLEDVWPRDGRILLGGRNLGDAWRHSLLGTQSSLSGIVPFHKLSQWLTYSLLEPMHAGGLQVTGLDALTGLPEYRNGGLFLDMNVLTLKDPKLANVAHAVDSELCVEWRALTVVLLDKTAEILRQRMNVTAKEFPLAKVLEAGTWKAGRKIAAQKRTGGLPPLQVLSDGTVF